MRWKEQIAEQNVFISFYVTVA